jgi:hypothetical protein
MGNTDVLFSEKVEKTGKSKSEIFLFKLCWICFRSNKEENQFSFIWTKKQVLLKKYSVGWLECETDFSNVFFVNQVFPSFYCVCCVSWLVHNHFFENGIKSKNCVGIRFELVLTGDYIFAWKNFFYHHFSEFIWSTFFVSLTLCLKLFFSGTTLINYCNLPLSTHIRTLF